MAQLVDKVETERERIRAEYKRREREVPPDLYAPWEGPMAFMAAERKRVAAAMLHDAGVFPSTSSQCLEIGYGAQGWLGDLITWGVKESQIHGIELDADRAERARQLLPVADLRIGDATSLPWLQEAFDLVIASTVFTSILDSEVRRLVADEITRVLRPGGALLWYDFRINNPRNPNVRRVTCNELRQLFPVMRISVRSVTLAPPLSRIFVPWSWSLATCLQAVPILRTHLLAVLVKPV